MNNIIISFPDVKNFKFFMENNVDGFLVGIKGFSENFNYLLKQSELNKICKILKEKNKKIYIMLNKVYFNHEMDGLKLLLYKISKLEVNAVIFSDMAVFNIVKENKLDINIIWSSKLVTNFRTINFLEKRGLNGFLCSSEITIDEFINIAKNTNSNCFIKLFGYTKMATSSRKLISNYFDYTNIKKDSKKKYYMKDKINNEYYPIIESDNTNFFSSKILNGILEYKRLINENIDFTILLDDYLIPENTFYNVIEAFVALKNYPTDDDFAGKLKMVVDSNNFNNTDNGFLNKNTIFKVKNNE
ncbi:MAG: U32 family peptidase [Bacilli bacterium]|nr:U32 family peptidase [Bacilli bacterium]